MARHATQDWVQQQLRLCWRWAGKVVRQIDGRWSSTILKWDPNWDGAKINPRAHRNQGHPAMRWTDHLENFCRSRGLQWATAAADEKVWEDLEEDFINSS